MLETETSDALGRQLSGGSFPRKRAAQGDEPSPNNPTINRGASSEEESVATPNIESNSATSSIVPIESQPQPQIEELDNATLQPKPGTTQLALSPLMEEEKVLVTKVSKKKAKKIKTSFLSNLGSIAEMLKDDVVIEIKTDVDLSGVYTVDEITCLLSCPDGVRNIAIASAKRGFILNYDGEGSYTLRKGIYNPIK